jgi:hypothetical protein
MTPDTSSSRFVALLAELRDEGATLLRQEVALAKAELTEKAKEAGKSAAELATGGAVAYAGLVILLVGVSYLVRHGLVALGVGDETAQWLGFLLVGGIAALVGWRLLRQARKHLTTNALKPTQTIGSLRDSGEWAKNKIHPTHEPAR